MEANQPFDEQALRAQLAQARQKLDGLVEKLRAVDGELEGLAGERKQHQLLNDVCGALERLGELGGAQLFWGDGAADGAGADRIRAARGRIDAFEKRLGEIEDRRESLVDEIEQQERCAWLVEDAILEAQEQAARKAEEWVVEREVDAFPFYTVVLPWSRGGEDDWRFRKSLATSLAVALLLFLLSSLIGLPMPDLRKPIEPQRLTYLLPQRPKTPPPSAQPEPKPQASKKPVEKSQPEKATPKRGPEQAPEQAPGTKGILAFREQLAGVADADAASRLGSKARIDHAGEAASGPPERSLVTTRAPGSSGGINLAALSRGIGGSGQQLEGVEVARAASAIASLGGAGGVGRPVGGDGALAGRTDEEIQIVFDRHKAALYRLYNRELRSDSSLRGQVILRLTIEPDGRVSMCVLQSTDMRAPQLTAEVVERVKAFDFGAKDGITAVTILYPIDFLPAT